MKKSKLEKTVNERNYKKIRKPCQPCINALTYPQIDYAQCEGENWYFIDIGIVST